MLRFPRTKFVDENGLYQQLQKMKEELGELEAAHLSEPMERVADELMDYFQAGETFARMLQERHGVHLNDAGVRCVIRTRERGYYDQATRQA